MPTVPRIRYATPCDGYHNGGRRSNEYYPADPVKTPQFLTKRADQEVESQEKGYHNEANPYKRQVQIENPSLWKISNGHRLPHADLSLTHAPFCANPPPMRGAETEPTAHIELR